jgi:dTDP-4-amino-4,6-dideoxygalactose transaminase
MAAQGEHRVTELFEQALSEYTGAPYVVAVDNCSSALLLALLYEGVKGKKIYIPCNTYMSVPCMIKFAGAEVAFYEPWNNGKLKGEYSLGDTKIIDSALRFRFGMFRPGHIQCLSFSGPFKHLKLGKGGAILTDSKEAYEWFKRARNSGRNECSYHDDNFTQLGFNFYMLPEIAAKGLGLMRGMPKHNEDLELPYPDLSKFPIYTTPGFDMAYHVEAFKDSL